MTSSTRITVERSRTLQLRGAFTSEVCLLRVETDADGDEGSAIRGVREALDADLDLWERDMQEAAQAVPSPVPLPSPGPGGNVAPGGPQAVQEPARTVPPAQVAPRTAQEAPGPSRPRSPAVPRWQAPRQSQAAPAPSLPPPPKVAPKRPEWARPGQSMPGIERKCSHASHPSGKPRLIPSQQWDTTVAFYGEPLCIDHVPKRA